MELRHLRYFVAVAEEQHFGRAAERLHMAQPPLSQQIRRLEAELGVELLHRTTRRVELSAAGELLLERARTILAAADAAAEDCRRAAAGEIGRLSVGFTGSTTYALLPSVATALREGLPGVELELHGEMLTPAQVEGLLARKLDLGLLRPPVRAHELTVEVIRSEPLIAVLPEGHRLAQAEEVTVRALAEEPFVAYAPQLRSVLQGVVEEACAAHGFHPRVAMPVTETSTLVSFVAAGVGVSLVPASVSGMSVAGAVYRPLAGDVPRVQIALAWRTADDSPLLTRALRIVHSAVMRTSSETLISHKSRL
jgi:DNA-binding transcriptional LysR family regulator